jgi:hypothetical protein
MVGPLAYCPSPEEYTRRTPRHWQPNPGRRGPRAGSTRRLRVTRGLRTDQTRTCSLQKTHELDALPAEVCAGVNS